jgi:hypothetical protein
MKPVLLVLLFLYIDCYLIGKEIELSGINLEEPVLFTEEFAARAEWTKDSVTYLFTSETEKRLILLSTKDLIYKDRIASFQKNKGIHFNVVAENFRIVVA